MKKLGVLLGLVLLLAVPVAAFAWHGGVSATPDCEGVTVTADPENPYWQDSHLPNLVKWVVTDISGDGFFSWEDETELDGVVTVQWRKYTSVLGIIWFPTTQYHTENFGWSAEKPDCYVSCAPGNETYTVEGEPYWDAELGAYVTPYEIFDAETDEPCGEGSDHRPTGRCAFDDSLPADSDALKRAGYGLAELWGPGGEYATLYIYPDANGKLPTGIGVERQQCVLGWTAVRSGAFEFVYRDCAGRYWFNGHDITPRADVLKDGICKRDGACIVE